MGVLTREAMILLELTMVTMLQILQQQICSSGWLACDCWERLTFLSIKSSYFGTQLQQPKGRELIWTTGTLFVLALMDAAYINYREPIAQNELLLNHFLDLWSISQLSSHM